MALFKSRIFFILSIAGMFALYFIGCGGSEPTIEDEAVTDTYEEPAVADTSQEDMAAEQPVQEDTTQEEPVQEDTTQAPVEQTPVETAPQGPTTDQLQQELDALKSENMQLQDHVTQTENENKNLSTKVSDLEAALAAAKAAKKEERPKMTSRSSMPGKSSAAEIQQYTDAVKLTKQKNYSGAISQFEALLSSGLKDDYADNAHYWIGESYFQLKKYNDAISHFQQVANYKFSEKKDDAQLMIAQSYERLGQREKAMNEYRKLVEMYPASEYAMRARAKVK